MRIYQYLFVVGVMLFVLSACVRPSPRPENVQITEVPVLDPLPPSPTPELVITVIATAEGDTAVDGETVEGEATPIIDNPTVGITWPQSHEVASGDTLSRISVIYNVPIEEIIAANSLVNPDALELGQVLTIPEPGTIDLTAVSTPEPATEAEATAEPATEQVYVVQAGDTLFRIALAYGTTVEVLADYNGLTNIDALELGQEILIPPAE